MVCAICLMCVARCSLLLFVVFLSNARCLLLCYWLLRVLSLIEYRCFFVVCCVCVLFVVCCVLLVVLRFLVVG